MTGRQTERTGVQDLPPVAVVRKLLLYIVLVAPFLLALVVLRPDRLGLAAALVSAGTALAGFAAWPVWIAGSPNRRSFPFLPMATTFYGFTFGLTPFLIDFGWVRSDAIWNYNLFVMVMEPDPAILGSVTVALLLFVGMLVLAGSAARRLLPPLRLPALSIGELRAVLWLLTAGYLAWRLVPGLRNLPSIDQFFQPAGLVLVAGWFLSWRRGYLRRPELVVLLGIILPAELFFRARDFLITDVMILAVLVAMLLLQAGMRKTLAAITVAGLLVMSAYDVFSGYRSKFHHGQVDLPGLWQIYTDMWSGLGDKYVTRQWSEPDMHTSPGPVGALTRRFSLVWLYHRVAEDTPDRVPYWMGESYRPLVGAAVPRLLWPGKPVEDSGFRFGERYGFLKEADRRTSLNVPWIVELRANFGLVGVLAGMALFGVLFALLDRLLNRPGGGVPEAAVGLGLIAPLVYPESNFSVMTGSLPLALAAFAVWFSSPLIWRRFRRS